MGESQCHRERKAAFGEFPFQDQVKDLPLFLIVMQQIMCRLLQVTEKLLLAPIYGARFL